MRWAGQDEAEETEVLGLEGVRTDDKLCLLNTLPQRSAVNTPVQLELGKYENGLFSLPFHAGWDSGEGLEISVPSSCATGFPQSESN